MDKLSHIMSQLSLAMEHESDPDVEHQLRAVAGLLLLPPLLKDNSSYFITALEVSVRPILRIGEYSLVALQHRRIRYIGLRVSADAE